MYKILFILIICCYNLDSFSQIGIGTTNPDASAILDISSTTKGLLIPRVSLLSRNNSSPMNQHVFGMLVYNTSDTNDLSEGVYINNGSSWLAVGDLIPKTIEAGDITATGQIPNGYNSFHDSNGNYVNTVTLPVSGMYLGQIFIIDHDAAFNVIISKDNTNMSADLTVKANNEGAAFIWLGNKWGLLTNYI